MPAGTPRSAAHDARLSPALCRRRVGDAGAAHAELEADVSAKVGKSRAGRQCVSQRCADTLWPFAAHDMRNTHMLQLATLNTEGRNGACMPHAASAALPNHGVSGSNVFRASRLLSSFCSGRFAPRSVPTFLHRLGTARCSLSRRAPFSHVSCRMSCVGSRRVASRRVASCVVRHLDCRFASLRCLLRQRRLLPPPSRSSRPLR